MPTTDPHTAINATETALIGAGVNTEWVRLLTEVQRAAVDGTDPLPSIEELIGIPVQRKPTGAPLSATCNHCPWVGNRFTASLHEHDAADHRVTVWDSSSTQVPRALWAPQGFPQAS